MDARQIVIFQELASTLIDAGVELPLAEVRDLSKRFCSRIDETCGPDNKPQGVRPVLLKPEETAKILRCSKQMLRRFVEEEGLRAIPKNPGAERVQYLFRPEDIREFLELKSLSSKR